MKKVDFNKLQAGDLVEVPRTQFAPMRSGWNGWLFSEAVVIRKGVNLSRRLRAAPLSHWKRHYNISPTILWTQQNLLSVWQRM